MPEGEPDRLSRLGERIAAAREAQRPRRSRVGEEYRASSLAWRMVTDLVAGLLVGGGMGWGLDRLLGTTPVFLLLLGLLGLVAGIRLMMRTAEAVRREGETDGTTGTGGPGDGP